MGSRKLRGTPPPEQLVKRPQPDPPELGRLEANALLSRGKAQSRAGASRAPKVRGAQQPNPRGEPLGNWYGAHQFDARERSDAAPARLGQCRTQREGSRHRFDAHAPPPHRAGNGSPELRTLALADRA